MIRVDAAHTLRGLEVQDSQGERIGKVREVWTDVDTGEAVWAWVDTGFLGCHHAFLPLREAVVVPEHLVVSMPAEVVAEAPRVTPTGDVMEDVEQDVLTSYYRTEVPA